MNYKPSSTNQSKAKKSEVKLQPHNQANSSPQHKVQISSFKGAVPDPDTVERYQRIYPGAVEYFFSTATKEQDNRHTIAKEMIELEKLNLINEANEKRRGQNIAFLVCVLVVALSAYGFYTNNAAEVKWIMGGALATIVALFLGAKWFLKKNSKEENKEEE